MADSKKINKKNIAKLLSDWCQEFSVLTPSRESGTAAMAEWDGNDVSFLNWYRNTVIPPRDSFLPFVEEMFAFYKDKDGYKIDLPSPKGQKQLIFGVRSCVLRFFVVICCTVIWFSLFCFGVLCFSLP